ncbi:MAG TPA: hypothetical protein VF785_15845 [Gemmatimonadaceae bacterium]
MSDIHSAKRDGITVGLVGYASVALFYSAFDFLAARGNLHTVNVLGQAVFRGLRDPAVLRFPVPLDAGAIFLYNALHLALALTIGLIVAGLVAFAERHSEQRRAIRFIIAAGFVVTVGTIGLLTNSMRPVLPWWSIVVANSLATLLAGAYLVTRHPGLWRRLALAQA